LVALFAFGRRFSVLLGEVWKLNVAAPAHTKNRTQSSQRN